MRAAALMARDLLGTVREVRPGDVVVLSTLGPRAGLYAAAIKVRRPNSVTVFDFLHSPRSTGLHLRWLLRSCVDTFVVIRRGDRVMLEREYGVTPEQVHFVPWCVGDTSVFDEPTRDGDYLYAAGWAHRDWATLLEALRMAPVRAILAPGGAVPSADLPAEVTIIDMPAPERGRALAAAARTVVVPLKDCDYAAGPLVLLDALAMGKPVIASEANGNRDYVEPEMTALTVPPHDAAALSAAIKRIWNNSGLRGELGRSARAAASTFTPRRTWTALLAAARGQCDPAAGCPCGEVGETAT